ncbi:TspO/MBR family protein [Rhodococcus sp. 24CO]|uniref:TspO/MBR family protein n=1 Tax=Rhodococcus sp. 24CO TaxID=3117460 RepID=UPI003D3370E1
MSEQLLDRIPRNLARTGALTTLTALVGSAASRSPEKTLWFRNLRKPAFQPPAVVFPVVWTALYADIAVTSAIAFDRLDETGDHANTRRLALALLANLTVNAGWSWVFFRSHRLAAAPVIAAALAVSSSDLVIRVGRVDRSAGVALAPYPLWCSFATVLSAAIWRNNR